MSFVSNLSSLQRPAALRFVFVLTLGCLLAVMGCNGGGKGERDPEEAKASENSPPSNTSTNAQAEATRPAPITDIGDNNPNLLAAIGDSLTAGSAVTGPSYPARLSNILGKTVQNRGVPGATSAEAIGQANGALSSKPSHLLIMFGTNDIFREVPPDTVAANIRAAVLQARANKTIPVVATIPPFLRSDFQQGFANSYNNRIKQVAGGSGARVADVAREFGSGAGLIQEDGYHPNDQGTAIIAFAFANAIRR